MKSSTPVRFGPFEWNLETGELRKYGVLVKLQDQPAKLLAALLERPGELVSRAELVQLLWPDGTFVDFDRGLNAAVTRLRQALSDSAERPRYVETVARRGYRFVGSVESAGAAPNDTHGADAAAAVPVAGRRWTFIAVAVALATVIGGVWLLRSERPAAPPFAPVPLTTLDGIETEPSFSPDASQVAFAWNGPKQDNFDIYVKVVGAGAPVRLTSDPAPDRGPVWSPDGRYVAFARQGRGLFIVPPAGGTERQIVDRGAAPCWSPDGKHLLFTSAGEKPFQTAIYAVAVDGGIPRPLVAVPAPRRVDALALSPDGRWLAYSSCHALPCELMAGEVDGQLNLHSDPRRVANRPGGINAIAWTANSRSLILSEWEGLGLGSGLRLTRVELDRPEEVQPLAFGGQNAAAGAISRSGSKVAYAQFQHNTDIWKIEGGEASRSPLSSTLNDESPQFSPDGKRVAFSSHRSGRQEVWVANADGSQAQQLTSSKASGTPRWSPDAKWIVYDTLSAGNDWDIAVIPAAGGAPKQIISHPALDISPSFSRDGEWVYFTSDRAGEAAIYRVRAGGDEPVRVADHGGIAFESMDGESVVVGAAGLTCKPLTLHLLSGGPGRQLAESVCMRGVAVTGRGIYFIAGPDLPGQSAQQYEVRLVDPATGVTKVVGKSASGLYLGQGLTVSPDGKTILMSASTQSGSDLYLVENFR